MNGTRNGITPLRLLVAGRGGTIQIDMYGGTAEQLRWLLQAPGLCAGTTTALAEAMTGVEDWHDRLLRAVGYPLTEQRVWDSQELLRDLWRADGGLGPYPLLDLLATFQTEHAYYPAYRDHLVHQLRVWLLGLYLLQRLPRLRDAVVDEVAGEPAWAGADPCELCAEALRRWLVTACWHDLGYVFEVQSAHAPQELVDRSFKALNATFAAPLAELGVLPREQELRWQRRAPWNQQVPSWPDLEEFDSLVVGHGELWQQLAPAGWQSDLAGRDEESGGLQAYLELCHRGDFVKDAGKRPGFIDHGIAGALLLLCLHDFTLAYTRRMAQLMAEKGDDRLQAVVAGLGERLGTSVTTVEAAARAIALHNVAPGLLRPAVATDRKLTLPDFFLRLDAGGGGTAQPLAYLLALADGLQLWDRPRFTAPRAPDDIGLIDQEVLLTAGEGRVWLRFKHKEPDARNRFEAVRKELAERLYGIDSLLACGITSTPEQLLDIEKERALPATPGGWDLQPYLDAILKECGTIELRGIMPRGRARRVLEVPIQELYAPLCVEGGGGDDLWQLLVTPEHRSEHLGEMGLDIDIDGTAVPPRVLLLVGAPGSGKSTFLRMTAAVLAHALGGQPWALEHPAARAFLDARRNLPVPVFMRLSELSRFMRAEERERDLAVDAAALIHAYLAHWAQTRGTGIPAEVIESWLRDGSALLLLDGLDEIPSRQLRERTARIISNAVDDRLYGACRFCLTSRPLRDEEYHPLLLPRTIEGLGDEAITRFLQCWASYVSGRSEGDGSGKSSEEYTRDLLDQVRRATPAIRSMLRNPLMLTCLAVIHWNEGRLPEQRAELLEAIVTWLLRERHVHDDTVPDYGEHHRRQVFQTLARTMHCRKGGRVRELSLAEATAAVSGCFPGDNDEQRRLAARRFLESEMVASGIITPRGQDNLQYWHLSFQELLVAGLLHDSTEDRWPELLTAKRLADPEWREVVLLLAGLLGNSQRTQALLRLILEPSCDGPLADKARAYGLAMAAINDLRTYRFVPDAALGLDRLGHEVLRIFTPEGVTVPISTRVEAAEALGQAGDPRLAAASWVEVKPGLCFGKYPVTVQEYARFVDAGGYDEAGFGAVWIEEWQAGVEQMLQLDGYKDADWLKNDRQRRLPADWQRQLVTPNSPVVNVSWYEADAYCRWLTTSERHGFTYRLPSGSEWEHAARGKQGKGTYPWGDDDPGKGDNARANYRETGIGHPTPVGLFPTGAAQWGEYGELLDMAGNVWEWCSDTLSQHGQSEDAGLFRPLRGGAYWSGATDLEVSCRRRYRAARWYDDFGFRVVRCGARCGPPAVGC